MLTTINRSEIRYSWSLFSRILSSDFIQELRSFPSNRTMSDARLREYCSQSRGNLRAVVTESGIQLSHCNLGQQAGNAWLVSLTDRQLTASGFSCAVTLRHLWTTECKSRTYCVLVYQGMSPITYTSKNSHLPDGLIW